MSQRLPHQQISTRRRPSGRAARKDGTRSIDARRATPRPIGYWIVPAAAARTQWPRAYRPPRRRIVHAPPRPRHWHWNRRERPQRAFASRTSWRGDVAGFFKWIGDGEGRTICQCFGEDFNVRVIWGLRVLGKGKELWEVFSMRNILLVVLIREQWVLIRMSV